MLSHSIAFPFVENIENNIELTDVPFKKMTHSEFSL